MTDWLIACSAWLRRSKNWAEQHLSCHGNQLTRSLIAISESCCYWRDQQVIGCHQCLTHTNWSFNHFMLKAITPYSSIFIRIDAHALIDEHLSIIIHQAPGRQKSVKLMIFVSKMHRSMMICLHICNYSVLWWWFWGKSFSLSLCTNLKFCSRSVRYD